MPVMPGLVPIGAKLGSSESAGVIESRPSPPPLWGRAREGGRFGLDETQQKRRLSRLPPPPALPHKGGGSSRRPRLHQSELKMAQPSRNLAPMGLVPGLHAVTLPVSFKLSGLKAAALYWANVGSHCGVDGRDEPGHDGTG